MSPLKSMTALLPLQTNLAVLAWIDKVQLHALGMLEASVLQRWAPQGDWSTVQPRGGACL